MSYAVTTMYDSRIPSWTKNASPFRLIACHDTEGGQGRAGALGTRQFLIDRADRGASYHELWWYHEATDEFGVIRIVPPNRAAGSVAPRTDVYQPTQWVKDSLGSGWWDPNQGIYAVSIAGRVADVDRYAKNPKFLAHAHRRMMELWKELGVNRRAEHFQFQPSNRSDWGRTLTPALGGLVTSDRWQPQEKPMNPIMPISPTIMTIRDGTSIRTLPDLSAASSPWVLTGRTAEVPVIGKVTGEDWGLGSLWYVYIISTGNLRFFHHTDVLKQRVLLDPAKVVSTDCSTEVAAATQPLQTTINEQTDRIASLMTQVSEAEAARLNAEAAAREATEAAGDAVALKDALIRFLG